MFESTIIDDLCDDEESQDIRELDEWFHREMEGAIGSDDSQQAGDSVGLGCQLTGRLGR